MLSRWGKNLHKQVRPQGLGESRLLLSCCVAFWVLLAGCQQGPDRGSQKQGLQAAPTVDLATAGRVNVRVRFQGERPQPKPIVMRSAPQCMGLHSGPVYDQAVVVGEDGRLANAVVWVEEGLPEGGFPVPEEPVVIDQRGCLYEPRVVTALVGQSVEFRNSDPEPHNVHTKPKFGRGTNFMLSRTGTSRIVRFERPEVAVPVGCDVHPWMVAYIAVLPHPFGAVTRLGADVVLGPLPPGKYTVAVWHEKFGVRRQTVNVGPQSEVSLEFIFGDA
ncbi:MAG: hypothetical protein KatS3mg077_3067 [Candidatus Binatia bacterium]|nr:MAG: hypothetical protein KatS3mg077_3067 [Candidatus Binatia bacterium]